jgi:hypothetical protein
MDYVGKDMPGPELCDMNYIGCCVIYITMGFIAC